VVCLVSPACLFNQMHHARSALPCNRPARQGRVNIITLTLFYIVQSVNLASTSSTYAIAGYQVQRAAGINMLRALPQTICYSPKQLQAELALRIEYKRSRSRPDTH